MFRANTAPANADVKIFKGFGYTFLGDFLQCVKEYPCIWNIQNPYYDHPEFKERAYGWIKINMKKKGHSIDDSALLWGDLKLAYYKERVEEYLSTGQYTGRKNAYLSTDLMTFMNINRTCILNLYDVVLKEKGSSNITTNTTTVNNDQSKQDADAVKMIQEVTNQAKEAIRIAKEVTEGAHDAIKQANEACKHAQEAAKLAQEATRQAQEAANRADLAVEEVRKTAQPKLTKETDNKHTSQLSKDLAAVKANLLLRRNFELLSQATINDVKAQETNKNIQNTATANDCSSNVHDTNKQDDLVIQIQESLKRIEKKTQKVLETIQSEKSVQHDQEAAPPAQPETRMNEHQLQMAQATAHSLALVPDVAAVRADLFSRRMEEVPKTTGNYQQVQKMSNIQQDTTTNVNSSVTTQDAAAKNEVLLRFYEQKEEILRRMQMEEEFSKTQPTMTAQDFRKILQIMACISPMDSSIERPTGIHTASFMQAAELHNKYRQQQRDTDLAMIRNMKEDSKKEEQSEAEKKDKDNKKNSNDSSSSFESDADSFYDEIEESDSSSNN